MVVKDVALKILNSGHAYITLSVIKRFLLVHPEDRVLMELQCTLFSYQPED